MKLPLVSWKRYTESGTALAEHFNVGDIDWFHKISFMKGYTAGLAGPNMADGYNRRPIAAIKFINVTKDRRLSKTYYDWDIYLQGDTSPIVNSLVEFVKYLNEYPFVDDVPGQEKVSFQVDDNTLLFDLEGNMVPYTYTPKACVTSAGTITDPGRVYEFCVFFGTYAKKVRAWPKTFEEKYEHNLRCERANLLHLLDPTNSDTMQATQTQAFISILEDGIKLASQRSEDIPTGPKWWDMHSRDKMQKHIDLCMETPVEVGYFLSHASKDCRCGASAANCDHPRWFKLGHPPTAWGRRLDDPERPHLIQRAWEMSGVFREVEGKARKFASVLDRDKGRGSQGRGRLKDPTPTENSTGGRADHPHQGGQPDQGVARAASLQARGDNSGSSRDNDQSGRSGEVAGGIVPVRNVDDNRPARRHVEYPREGGGRVRRCVETSEGDPPARREQSTDDVARQPNGFNGLAYLLGPGFYSERRGDCSSSTSDDGYEGY